MILQCSLKYCIYSTSFHISSILNDDWMNEWKDENEGMNE